MNIPGVIALVGIAFQLAFVNSIATGQTTPFLGRGVTVNGKSITEKDLSDFAATGGNLVRLQFQLAPLEDLQPPYAINPSNFALLDRDLDWCRKYNLNCIIDPHQVPGLGAHREDSDPMWSNRKFQDLAVNLWSTIAQRASNRGSEVAGFDLMNEPAVPAGAKHGSLGDWNALTRRMVQAIRAKDARHPIIIETPDVMVQGRPVMNRSASFRSYFAIPPDSNVIYSIHLYDPYALTFEREPKVTYPGRINGRQWDANTVAQMLAPAAEFQTKYHVQIYVGEFSCARWAGDSGNRWMKDMIDYFEAHHWSWTYLVWRGADIWDAEKSNFDRNDHRQYPTTPRLKLLKSYWKRGRQE